MSILLLADHDNTSLSDQTARALTAALLISEDVDILVAGKNAGTVAAEASTLSGVKKVLLVQGDQYEHALAEPIAALIASLATDYRLIIGAASSTGKSVLPRVAAIIDVPQISEIVEVVSGDTFKRPIYAGNALQTVRVNDGRCVVSVRTSSFSPANFGHLAVVESISTTASFHHSEFISENVRLSERPDLASAKVVISGGRALGSAENFQNTITPLADKLNAAIGASRAAVDAGYAPNDWQVGQTGKVVAPDLYIACGISGAIQHLAGMKDSKIIVAINTDEEAPIFQVADYALVGDLFQVVPELTQAL